MNGDLRESGPSSESIVAQRSALLVVLLSRDTAGSNSLTLGYAGREMCSSSTPFSNQTTSLAVRTRSCCHSLRVHQTSARCDLARLSQSHCSAKRPRSVPAKGSCAPVHAGARLASLWSGHPNSGWAAAGAGPAAGHARCPLLLLFNQHLCCVEGLDFWALLLMCILVYTGAAMVLGI